MSRALGGYIGFNRTPSTAESSGVWSICEVEQFERAGTWSLDPDAYAFLTAASITNTTQRQSIYSLVESLKANGVWSKLLVCYPFVGGAVSSHKWNLKDPRDLNAAYRLTFSGTWTHSSTGVAGNGSSIADTNFTPSVALSATSYAEMTYYRTNPTQSQTYPSNGARIDSTNPVQSFQTHFYSNDGNTYVDFGKRVVVANSTYGNATGAYSISRLSDNLIKIYRNGVVKATGTDTNNQLPGRTVYLGGLNYNNSGDSNWHTREMSFYAISTGLSDQEMSDFYSAVQSFQTTLGRQV